MAGRSSFISGISRLVEESGRRQRQQERIRLRDARETMRLARAALKDQEREAKAQARDESERAAREAQAIEEFIDTPLANCGKVAGDPQLAPTALYRRPFTPAAMPEEAVVAERLFNDLMRNRSDGWGSAALLVGLLAAGLVGIAALARKTPPWEHSAWLLGAGAGAAAALLAIVLFVRLSARRRQGAVARTSADGAAREQRERDALEQRRAETDHNATEDARINTLRQFWDGEPSAVEAALTTALDALTFPIDVAAHVRMIDAQRFVVDLDLPEIEDLPAETCRLLKSGRLSFKDKSEKLLAAQYANLACGLAFLYAAEVMRAVPTAREVSVNGYTDRIDPRTGHEVENFVVAARFERATLALLSLDTIDPIAAISQFDHRFSMARNGDLAAVEPIRPETH